MNAPHRIAVIATVRDERGSIDDLLRSLLENHRQPEEIIIADGGSRDGTLERLQEWRARLPQLRVLSVPGSNRSQGRNRAIEAAMAPWIAVTDGGVRLDAGWLETLTRPLEEAPPPDVVAGFFQAAPASLFELALGATTLPVADEIDGASFLPSSRSVLFSRSAWQAAGGYPEWLDYGEDLVFDLAMRRAGARFVWAPEAIAYFRPRRSLRSFFRQYHRYARGDGKALLWPRRHAVRYASYAGLVVLLWLAVRRRRDPVGALALSLIGLGGVAYLRRPYRRLVRMEERTEHTRGQRLRALALLPVCRLTGDVAKMLGYPAGRFWRWQHGPALPADPTAPRHSLHRG